MHTLLMLLFATTGGLVLSGIVANFYRALARTPKSRLERVIYMAVMSVAGPSVLIDNSTRSFRQKDCSRTAYAFAIGLTFYWCFALGFLVIALKHYL